MGEYKLEYPIAISLLSRITVDVLDKLPLPMILDVLADDDGKTVVGVIGIVGVDEDESSGLGKCVWLIVEEDEWDKEKACAEWGE
jgi:hypothetical protein